MMIRCIPTSANGLFKLEHSFAVITPDKLVDIHVLHWKCYDSSPIYTYFPTLLTYDAPPESPYPSGPPTGPLEPMDRLMPNPYPN